MSNSVRWTQEQLEQHLKRAQQEGRVRTHSISKKQPKYRNKMTERDGLRFHSKREADRYSELLLLQSAGEISELDRQVSFDLTANGMKVCRYVADFVYRDKQGERVVEDAKGYATTTYRLKRALMLACHGITVRET